MASFFGHVVVAATANRLVAARGFARELGLRFLGVAVLFSVLPDFDVAAFALGIPYASPWGHRGFTHSLLFAALTAPLAARLAVAGLVLRSLRAVKLSLFFFAVTATHPLLDALTNGGLGVALLWPFDDRRYFFPYRPIEVSPIGVAAFFGEQGLDVLRTELVFIVVPCAALLLGQLLLRRLRR